MIKSLVKHRVPVDPTLDQAIKDDLENLGKEYGNNLFVGFWSMADERYRDVAEYFSLKPLPAIVIVTGV
jgi:hypothetical protein